MQSFTPLVRYRELLRALVVRHLSMRYRGSLLGFFWSFLNPLCLMLIYTLVFKYYIRFNQVENYSVFVFCGLLPWIWFTSALHEGTSSIVSSGHLITKSLFPAQLLPAVAVLTSMVHYLLSLPILLVFMLLTGVPLHGTLVFLPALILTQFIFCYGITLALSSLNVYYRDVQHILGNFLTFLFFLCPILYPLASVPEQFRFTLEYNPFALFTIFYHDIILNGTLPAIHNVCVLGVYAVGALAIGQTIFNRNQEGFAELL